MSLNKLWVFETNTYNTKELNVPIFFTLYNFLVILFNYFLFLGGNIVTYLYKTIKFYF